MCIIQLLAISIIIAIILIVVNNCSFFKKQKKGIEKGKKEDAQSRKITEKIISESLN